MEIIPIPICFVIYKLNDTGYDSLDNKYIYKPPESLEDIFQVRIVAWHYVSID